MQEAELLRHISRRSAGLSAAFGQVVVGPGDDCAVVRIGEPSANAPPDLLLLTVDQLVEGRHFAPGTPIDQIARKAVARSISDIAAMGGTPKWGLATGALPAGYRHADDLFDAMADWAKRFGAPLVGGDIAALPGSGSNTEQTQAAMVLTVTVGGTPHASRGAVLRSGARAGDEIWVTGRIGDSLPSGRHLTFEPRVAEGAWLCTVLGERLHAMIDLSDGLGRDAGRVAQTSDVRVVIDGAAVPLHAGAKGVESASADGEDYELLFACAPGAMESALSRADRPRTPLTRIGLVEAGAGCELLLPGGLRIDVSGHGWDHSPEGATMPRAGTHVPDRR